MSRSLIATLLAFGFLLAPWPAAAQEKPLLSREIRLAIEADGAAEGKARFAEVYLDQGSGFRCRQPGVRRVEDDRGRTHLQRNLARRYIDLAPLVQWTCRPNGGRAGGILRGRNRLTGSLRRGD